MTLTNLILVRLVEAGHKEVARILHLNRPMLPRSAP
jgi:hypothetical protein